MTDIRIIIPVADPALQNFDALVNELCGNYVAQDHTKQNFMSEQEPEIVPNPYSGLTCPDFTGKITLVSNSALTTPAEADNVVVDGPLSVTKMWNAGVAHAASEGATHVVILNEVSSINPHVFGEAVEQNADAQIINISDGGCFILTPDVSANETFRWWFADVDLFNRNGVAVYRNEFTDIVQNNNVPISDEMKTIVDADMAAFNSQASE